MTHAVQWITSGRWRVVGVMTACSTLATSAAADTVARRGGLPTLTGEVLLVNAGGVDVRTDTGVRQLVPWDQVHQVTSEGHAIELRNFSATAELAWRARSRIERHDTALAEPLFERLFEQYYGKEANQTGLVVAEGLLRCRLARGAHALAVIPALEVIRLRRAGLSHEATGTYGQLPPVIDDRFELCLAVPPVWLATPVLAKLSHDLANYDAGGDEVVAAIAAMYARSAARAMGAEPTDMPSLPDHLGVEFLRHIVDCGDNLDATREQSRNWLSRAEPTLPPFAQAWARFATGASLLSESGLVRQQRGLVNLLHVPALHAPSQPYLAGIALSLAAMALESHGDAEAARLLRSDLTSYFPNHPVLSAPLAGLPAAANTSRAPVDADSSISRATQDSRATKETS